MGIQSLNPKSMNLMEIAERVHCESLILHRIADILSSPHVERLEERRVEQFQQMFIRHVDLMGRAHGEWRLGNDLLEEAIEHVARVGLGPKRSQDLQLVGQMEGLLAVISDIDGILTKAESLVSDDDAYELYVDAPGEKGTQLESELGFVDPGSEA